MRSIKKTKVLYLFFILVGVSAFYFSEAYEQLSFNNIQNNLEMIKEIYHRSPFLMTGVFIAVYVLITYFSIPGAIVLTLLAGAVFGAFYGTILVSISCTTGATIAFLMSRYFFRDAIIQRYQTKAIKINSKLQKHGVSYLFTLRLIPVSPFVVINVLLGLTNINVWTYVWITFVGMLPGNFVYVYAGRRISEINSPSEILSLPILITLTCIGLMPLFFRWLISIFPKGEVQ